MRVFVVAVCLAFTTVCFGAVNKIGDLRSQIKAMVVELKSGDIVLMKYFVMHYADPEDLSILLQDQTIDEVVESFIRNNKDTAILLLEDTLKMEPEISDDGLTYTFQTSEDTLSKTGVSETVFRFSPEAKVFYVRN
jgi:ABC-type oligopeptide transport system substrate-binding subunit